MKVAIIGAGNVIFSDDGVGVYAAKFLEQNYDFHGDITIVDGGALGFGLMNYYQDYEKVIILDTITIEDDIGAIYSLPSSELLGLGGHKQTAHEVEIVQMLEICSMLEKMADVNIIGIIPQDIKKVQINLTQTIKERFATFIQTALNELENTGIKYTKKSKNKTLEEIIDFYAKPNSIYAKEMTHKPDPKI